MRFDYERHHNLTDAIIYRRVSSKAQVERGDGLDSQENRCREYAAYKGYTVETVFSDDLSGSDAARPGVRDMLNFLRSMKNKKNYIILIDDISRLARDIRIHLNLRDAFDKVGAVLETPSMEFRNDPESLHMEKTHALNAEYFRVKNAWQTIERMTDRIKSGYWCFAKPVGYVHQKVKGHNGKLLVRNEPVASVIQEALEGFASGRFDTQVEVKRFLESQPSFPKDLPDGQIRNQRVNDLLNRIVYAGYVEAPKWGIPPCKGKHEGLISIETYQRIQDRLKGGAKAPSRKDVESDFPLRGFVLCGDCEKPLTASWSKSKTGKKHPYYLCFNKACESNRKSIPRDKLEGDFEKLLQALQPTQNLFSLAKAMFKRVWDQRRKQMEVNKAAIEKELAIIEKQIEELVDRIVDSDTPTAIGAYEKRIAKLERNKLVAREKISNCGRPKEPFDKMFELAVRFLSNPWKLWSSGRLDDKKTVLKLAFSERLPYSRKNGFRTPQVSEPFRFLKEIGQNLTDLRDR